MWPSPSGAAVISWIPILTAVLVVVLRIYTRYKIRALGPDDYLMIIAAAWSLSYACMAQSAYATEPANQWEKAQRATKNSMSSIITYMSLLFSKTSIGVFLLRLLSPTMKAHRWFIIITLGLWYIVTWFRMIASFYPVCYPSILADPWITGCFEYRWSFGFAQLWNFYSIFIDFGYSMLPVVFISKLKMSRARKLALSSLVGLGWTAVIFTLIRAASPYKQNLLKLVPLATSMEQSIVIICGSLATLTPLYMAWTGGVPLKPRHRPESAFKLGETKQPILAKNSISTVGTQPAASHQRYADESTIGIRAP